MRSGLGAPLLAVLLGCAGCQQAASPVASSSVPADNVPTAIRSGEAATDRASASHIAEPTTPAGNAAAQAFIDPATGELREPTAAELATANRARAQAQAVTSTSTASASVKITALPNGLTEYDLGNRAKVDETACIQNDGSLGECTAAQRDALRKAAQKNAP